MNILKFFKTAPQVKSDKVLDLEKAGMANSIIEAVEDERKNSDKNYGESKDGKVKVRRVGSSIIEAVEDRMVGSFLSFLMKNATEKGKERNGDIRQHRVP